MVENFDEFGAYSATTGWADASTPAGNGTGAGIDWNAILQTGIPRLFDLAQTSIILENGRPVVTNPTNATRTNGAQTVQDNAGLLALVALGLVVFLVLK